MKLSIIIPNYNSAKTILNTLASISSQDHLIDEILLIDDASTDNSVSLVRKYYPRVKIFENNKNSGAGFSRNVGITNATGDYLLFIDSDIISPQNAISILINNRQSADILFPKIIYENGVSMYPNTKTDEEYVLISPAFLISRQALNKLNNSYFDPQYRIYCEDTDFFLKSKLLNLTCKYIPEVTVVHTVDKPRNREGRYYSEIVNSNYGAIKFCGYNSIKQLDHAFKVSNILKLFVVGIFNFNLFDAQTRNFDKAGSTLYKIKYMLTQKEQITDKGSVYLFFITLKGIAKSVKQIPLALRARRELRKILVLATTKNES